MMRQLDPARPVLSRNGRSPRPWALVGEGVPPLGEAGVVVGGSPLTSPGGSRLGLGAPHVAAAAESSAVGGIVGAAVDGPGDVVGVGGWSTALVGVVGASGALAGGVTGEDDASRCGGESSGCPGSVLPCHVVASDA